VEEGELFAKQARRIFMNYDYINHWIAL